MINDPERIEPGTQSPEQVPPAGPGFYAEKEITERKETFRPDSARTEHAEQVAEIAGIKPEGTPVPAKGMHNEMPGVTLPDEIPDKERAAQMEQIMNSKNSPYSKIEDMAKIRKDK